MRSITSRARLFRYQYFPLSDQYSSAPAAAAVRNDWRKSEIQQIYDMPLMDLVHLAASVHRVNFNSREVQQCTLLSIKTGGCVEVTFSSSWFLSFTFECQDCKYCSQSTRHKTFVKPTPTMKVIEVVEMARRAKESGSTRFCMGAAWRDVGEKSDRKAFGSVLEMVRQVCCNIHRTFPT